MKHYLHRNRCNHLERQKKNLNPKKKGGGGEDGEDRLTLRPQCFWIAKVLFPSPPAE